MREAFHAELTILLCDLATITRLSAQMMTTASAALHHADLGYAELVVSGKRELTARCEDVNQRCRNLLALQAPVGRDLRIVVASLRAVGDLG
jgi:phosphate transport system protein